MRRTGRHILRWLTGMVLSVLICLYGESALAAPVPGGTLDPTTIPKYATPLVIPPVMPKSIASPVPVAEYDIAVRQFKQQILPAPLSPTTVWSYGRAEDVIPPNFVAPVPVTNGVSFNYPAFTVENTANVPTTVRWINDLVADPTACAASVDKTIPACTFLPHLFPVDQTLHWANPPGTGCVMMGQTTDCETTNAAPYTGPVPLVTHVHGSHVQPHSDGYPEAWWLPGVPGTKGIPAGYVQVGSHFTQATNLNTIPGTAYYSYENTQPAATLWYHDHALGMTRLNVYAGPAGFWLLRGGANGDAGVMSNTGGVLSPGVLPGPAPVAGNDPNFVQSVRDSVREIPVVIQDRSFNSDGSLFYPASRTFFDGFTGPFIGNAGFTGPYNPGPPPTGPSDMPGIWNPEAFFNTIVVNGTTWPKFDVAPARYRLRLLDGCNSRTLNLSLFVVTAGPDKVFGTADDVKTATEIPFYQIGAEQGFLPKVVKITTGFMTALPGDGTPGTPVAAPAPEHALLMGPAERADVILDFTGMAPGTRIRMFNTAPDYPFQGFPTVPADSLTTGQIMDFVVSSAVAAAPTDATSTPPANLVLPAEAALGTVDKTRQVSLNEMDSDQVCVEVDAVGTIIRTLFSTTPNDLTFRTTCAATPVAVGNFAVPMGPRQALLGVLAANGLTAVPKKWGDPVSETPLLNNTEVWEIYNTTVDAHPIHLHLVRFEVLQREQLDLVQLAAGTLALTGKMLPVNPNELGYKDTVVAYPGTVTRIKAKFDIAGLYVWHCHIVEHEDNEMMRSFVVNTLPAISSVTSTTANGFYKAGASINVTVNFDRPISTAGLTISLNNGVVLNTNVLTNVLSYSANFTVAAGQDTPAGQFLTVTGITGSITDAAPNTTTNPAVPAGANLADGKQIQIDTAVPVVAIVAPTATVTNAATVQVSATVTDTGGVQSVTVNGIPATLAGGVYSATLPLQANSLNTITATATDLAGNQGSAAKTITQDGLPPTTTISPAAGTYAGATTVTLSSEPGAVIRYTTDGNAPTAASPVYTAPFVLSSATTTTITVKYFATDTAGNAEAVRTAAYIIHVSDLTNASVVINNGALYTNSTAATLSLAATDPLGITQMQVACDGVTFGTVEAFAATKGCTLTSGDGIKTVAVKFIDAIGTVYSPVSATITLKTSAPAVTATPAAGAYNGSVSVVLAGDPGASIYYTTNGFAPVVDPALLYAGPIQLTSTKTLKFFAVDQAGNQSAVQTGVYTIAGNDLTGSIKINSGSAFTNNAGVSLALTASDPLGIGKYMISNDGTTYQTVTVNPATPNLNVTVPWNLTTGDGLKTVYVKYVDTPTPNNVYGPFTAQITLDTVPPATTASPASGTYNGAINVVLASEAGASIYYTTNGLVPKVDPALLYTAPITLQADAKLMFFAVDKAGNQEALQTRDYVIAGNDLTGSITINNGAAYTTGTGVTLNLKAADPAGVIKYMLSNDNITYQTVTINPATASFSASVPWTLPAGDGVKTVYVKFVDAPAPNNVYGPFTAQITLDTTPPVTTAKPLSGAYNGAISATLGSETGAAIYYTTDGKVPVADQAHRYAGPITIPATTTLKYFAVDQAGNAEAVQTRSYTIAGLDLTGSVKINAGAARTANAAVTLTLAADDPLGIHQYLISNDDITYQTFTINSVATVNSDVPWTLSSGDGVKTVFVKYVDTPTPNNVYGPFTAQIILDTVAPQLSVTAPLAGAVVNTYSLTVTGIVSDAGGIRSVTVNGTPAAVGAGGAFTAALQLTPGANTITVVATDQTGNTATATRAVTLDVAPPQTSITPPPGIYSGSVAVTLGTNKPATTYYSLTGTDPAAVPANVYTGPITLTSGVTKTYTLKYFSVDSAGNAEAVHTATYTLHASDLTGRIAINGGQAYTRSPAVTLTLAATDAAGVGGYAISVDNGATYRPTVTVNPPVPSFSATVPLTLQGGDGLKTVFVKFTDALKVEYPPVMAQIILDTAAPITTAVPSAGTYTGKVSVALAVNEAGATTYYTTDGSVPTAASRIYTSPVAVGAPGTTVTVSFFSVDQAGNTEQPQSVVYAFAHLPDMTAKVSINKNKKYTKSRDVVLSYTASDPVGGGVSTVSFSNDGITFTTPIPYSPTTAMPWNLGAGDGLKTVYFRFTDKAAAPVSYTFTDSINLVENIDSATGDLDGDGKVDIADALHALRAGSGIRKLTPAEQARCDVAPLINGKPEPDGKIDAGDALLIVKKAMKLLSY